jgi:hypothetical protein
MGWAVHGLHCAGHAMCLVGHALVWAWADHVLCPVAELTMPWACHCLGWASLAMSRVGHALAWLCMGWGGQWLDRAWAVLVVCCAGHGQVWPMPGLTMRWSGGQLAMGQQRAV